MPPNTINLNTEVECATNGDRDAFERLVEAHQSMVCSVAYAVTGDFAQSEEIAQETFLLAWQRLAQLREPSRLASWLAAISRNLAKDAVRKSNREALARAETFHAAESKQEGGVDEEAIKAEREQITWDTVSKLPDAYRTTLILYYREDQSIREVARLLEITEDCAKQRLSRGRKMLRERVATVIEDTLRETRPDNVFTLCVLAALPALAAPAAAATTIASAAAATKAASVGAKPVTAALGVGMLGGLAGGIAGMTGGFFGMWASIKNAQTLGLRRYMLKSSAFVYGFVWLFIGYHAGCGTLLWPYPPAMGLAVIAGWAFYIPSLFLLITWSNRKGQEILEAEQQGFDVPDRATIAAAWRTFRWAYPAAILGSGSVILLTHYLPGVGAWWAIGIAAFSHYGFLRIFLHGAAISRDEVIFAETAPKLQTLPIAPAQIDRDPAQVKKLWLNDFGALCGSIFGISAAFVVGLTEQGLIVWSIVLACVQVALVSVALIALKIAPGLRGWIYFIVLSAAGTINAAVIFIKPMIWLKALDIQASGDDVGMAWRILAAAIFFAFCSALGLLVLVVDRSRRTA